jgi:hypothetical protein
MSRKQVFVLILGCVLLIAGFFVLIRMTQVSDVNNLGEMFADKAPQVTAAPSASAVSTAGKAAEEKAGFDIMLQKIVDLNIPVWGYVVIFLVLMLAIRFYTFRYEVKSAERSIAMRESAESISPPPEQKKTRSFLTLFRRP